MTLMPNEVGVICLAEAGEEQVQYELAMKYYFGVGRLSWISRRRRDGCVALPHRDSA